ncbi:MAG TPA: hypothetical protein VLT81_12145 [Chondromyces sp.]|nr:hypothetical protein [Chondromyces sp.]
MERRTMRRSRDRGVSLVELVVLLAVVAIIATVTVPALGDAHRAAALAGAAGRVRGLMFRCRAVAVMEQRSTGLVFERRPDGAWRCLIAADGDGDGILRRDIERGIDPVISEILEFAPHEAGLGILEDEFVPDPSGRGRLRGDHADPVRAGRGDIISFTPDGHVTPSSVYFSDRRKRMRVLRTYGASGRVISLYWRSGWPEWRAGAF